MLFFVIESLKLVIKSIFLVTSEQLLSALIFIFKDKIPVHINSRRLPMSESLSMVSSHVVVENHSIRV